MSELLNISVWTRDAVLYQGKAKALSSVNSRGKFDVLDHHANFISLIKDYLRITIETGEVREIHIKHGILRVYQNQVKAFLGIGDEGLIGSVMSDELS